MDVLASRRLGDHRAAGQARPSGAAEIEHRLDPVIAGGGPVVALQPIVDLVDRRARRRRGAEPLPRRVGAARPTSSSPRPTASAAGDELELLALRRAAEHLDRVDGYVADERLPRHPAHRRSAPRLLADLPVDRVLLELSEHDPVDDYDALAAVLDPFRAAGLRLAIDDVGAGFSSLRHIVVTSPDVIKIDRSLVSRRRHRPGPDHRSSARWSTSPAACGARVVAEGIETAEDAAVAPRPRRRLRAGLALRTPAVPEPVATPEPAPVVAIPVPRPYRTLARRI